MAVKNNDNYHGKREAQVDFSHKILFWAMLGMFFSVIILSLTSCFPNRKFAKAVKTLNEDPEKAAWYCAEKFPVKDTVIYRDSITFDTLYEYNNYYDTTILHDTITKTNTSPAKTIYKTVYKIKEIVRENTAKVQALELSLRNSTNLIIKKDETIEVLRKEANSWKALARKRFWWLLLVIGAAGGWILRKPLLRIIKPI